jgi:hypothetical protein
MGNLPTNYCNLFSLVLDGAIFYLMLSSLGFREKLSEKRYFENELLPFWLCISTASPQSVVFTNITEF